jgi:hypothetical protein
LVILPEVAASLLGSDHNLARKKQKLCMYEKYGRGQTDTRAARMQVIRLCSLLKNIFVAYLPHIIRPVRPWSGFAKDCLIFQIGPWLRKNGLLKKIISNMSSLII